MKRAALFLVLMLFGTAHAGEAAASWTQPTQNTDGSAIPASGTGALTGNRLEWGTCSSPGVFGTQIGQQAWTTPRAAYTVTNLGPGTYCFRAYASTQYGESGPSGVASKVIAPPLPAPPSGLTVAATVAYTLVKAPDRFVLLPVGTVPPDTQCNPAENVNGYYVVPRAAVTWSGTVRPDVVVARCS
jgi:hypothetical protein